MAEFERTKRHLYFEDSVVVGFVAYIESVNALVEGWRDTEIEFLKTHALGLRLNPDKAWSIYSIFLVKETCTAECKSDLLAIEEDFSNSRKVVRCNIITGEDVARALSLLGPIQRRITFTDENLHERLRGMLAEISPHIVKLLDTDVSIDNIATRMVPR